MEKQTGAYENAFETMKSAKRNFAEDKTTYRYKKSAQ
jgi:hypothetical protein